MIVVVVVKNVIAVVKTAIAVHNRGIKCQYITTKQMQEGVSSKGK